MRPCARRSSDQGALDGARDGTVHVSMATISVALAQELAAFHKQRGIAYVAAPVFGRPEAAQAAMLNIVAAGEAAALARVQPLFDAMGQKTWPLGAEPHRANAVKLAGNFMIAAAIEAMGEATALGRAHGVSSADLLDILTNTLFASPVYKGYGAQIAAAQIRTGWLQAAARPQGRAPGPRGRRCRPCPDALRQRATRQFPGSCGSGRWRKGLVGPGRRGASPGRLEGLSAADQTVRIGGHAGTLRFKAARSSGPRGGASPGMSDTPAPRKVPPWKSRRRAPR